MQSNCWKDADVDHSQTIWGDKAKLLWGIYLPHPPLCFGTPGSDSTMLADASECRLRHISFKCNEIYFLDIISLNGEISASSHYCVSYHTLCPFYIAIWHSALERCYFRQS